MNIKLIAALFAVTALVGCSNPIEREITELTEKRLNKNFDDRHFEVVSIELGEKTVKEARGANPDRIIYPFDGVAEISDEICAMETKSYENVVFIENMGGKEFSVEGVYEEGGSKRDREGELGSIRRLEEYSDDFSMRSLGECDKTGENSKFVFEHDASKSKVQEAIDYYQTRIGELDTEAKVEEHKKLSTLRKEHFKAMRSQSSNEYSELREAKSGYRATLREALNKIDADWSATQAAFRAEIRELRKAGKWNDAAEQEMLTRASAAEEAKDAKKAKAKEDYDAAIEAFKAKQKADYEALKASVNMDELEKKRNELSAEIDDMIREHNDIVYVLRDLAQRGYMDESEVPERKQPMMLI
jgi:hypothetical protein